MCIRDSTHTWQDSSDDAILRLTAGGSGSGNDDLLIEAGTDITLTPSGDTLTIDAAAGISFSGNTANGVVTYGSASSAVVESGLLYNGTTLTIQKAGVAQLDIDSYSTTNGVPAVLRLRHSNHGTIGSHTLSAVDAELANINFEGSSGSAFVRGALISAIATQNWSGSTNGTEMRFYTAPNTGGGNVEVMRMRNDLSLIHI